MYGDKYEALQPFLESLTPKVSSDDSKPVARRSLDLNTYAKALMERYSRLKLEAVEMTGSCYRELELGRIFVPQRVREC